MILSMNVIRALPPPLLRSCLPVFLVALLTGAAHAATTVTLRPTNTAGSSATNGDAFLAAGSSSGTSGSPSSNYGAAGALAVSAAGLTQGAFDSLLRFDVSTVKSTFDGAYGVGGWSIDSIALQLTTSTVNNTIFNTSATGSFNVDWLPTDSWVEGTGNPLGPTTDGVTWNDLATLMSSSQFQNTFAVANVGDGVTANYTLTPTAGLLSDVTAGSGSTSLLLSAADSSISALFNSRNFGTATRRPALMVTASAVPEPGRALLIMLGFAGIAQRRRKK